MAKQRVNGYLKAFILGCAVGAGSAILFAPQAGKKTRRQIQQRSSALKTQAEEGVAGIRDGVDDVVYRTQRQAEAIQKQGSKVLKEQTDRLADTAETLKAGVTRLTP